MFKHKSLFSLAAAVLLCLAMFISPLTANADLSGGLTLNVIPSPDTASLGENISYNYVITSSCNTTIGSLVLTDDLLGTISLPSTSLAPGDNISVSAIHTVVLADFPGPIENNATVTGITADNTTLGSSASASVTLNPLTSSVSVSLSASPASAYTGDNITYTYTVTNTGQADLGDLTLTDSRLGAISLGATTLASGASITATEIYTVLASDLPGPLSENATATATPPTGEAISATSETVSVTLNQTDDNTQDDTQDSSRTKAEILRERGVPGKGIDHAPGLQKPFNQNSYMWRYGSDNATDDQDNNTNGNGNGKGKQQGNGHGKGKK